MFFTIIVLIQVGLCNIYVINQYGERNMAPSLKLTLVVSKKMYAISCQRMCANYSVIVNKKHSYRSATHSLRGKQKLNFIRHFRVDLHFLGHVLTLKYCVTLIACCRFITIKNDRSQILFITLLLKMKFVQKHFLNVYAFAI